MNLDVLKSSFRDELQKISEVNLSGLSAETLMAYPKPQPMPSAAYEKAQRILAKVQQFPQHEPVEEKTAGPRPDMLPQLDRLYRRKKRKTLTGDPPPSRTDKMLSYGGHALAGAGAAKFLSAGVSTAREALKKAPISKKTEALALAGGATLGVLNKLRKDYRRREWARQQGAET